MIYANEGFQRWTGSSKKKKFLVRTSHKFELLIFD